MKNNEAAIYALINHRSIMFRERAGSNNNYGELANELDLILREIERLTSN